MNYLIDTNCFLTAHKGLLPIDIAPSFWDLIKDMANNKEIMSLNYVRDELYANNDDLKNWISTNIPSSFFYNFKEFKSYGEVVNWANSNKFYNQRAKDKFLRPDKADIYLVSIAKTDTSNYTIVTMETPAPTSNGIIKIPDACNQFGVKWISFPNLLRTLHKTF